jgi:hypothetical protein
VAEQERLLAELREEIARLKGLNGRPRIRPSGIEDASAPKRRSKQGNHRRRGKIVPRVADEDRVIKAQVPPGSRFKGYESFVVQDIVLRAEAIRYRRERWITPAGAIVLAPLPAGVVGHFGPELRRFVLAQHHQGQVTVLRLVAQLRGIGVAISKRQMMRLLIAGHDGFLAENRDVLRAGLQTAAWISVDDTGARPAGRNGFCTQIGAAARQQALADDGARSSGDTAPHQWLRARHPPPCHQAQGQWWYSQSRWPRLPRRIPRIDAHRRQTRHRILGFAW